MHVQYASCPSRRSLCGLWVVQGVGLGCSMQGRSPTISPPSLQSRTPKNSDDASDKAEPRTRPLQSPKFSHSCKCNRGAEERPSNSPAIQSIIDGTTFTTFLPIFTTIMTASSLFGSTFLFLETVVISVPGITCKICHFACMDDCLGQALHGCLISSHFSSTHSPFSSLNEGLQILLSFSISLVSFRFVSLRYIALGGKTLCASSICFDWKEGRKEIDCLCQGVCASKLEEKFCLSRTRF